MNDKSNKNPEYDKSLESESEFSEFKGIPLILPDDFNTPRDLDERIILEMSKLGEELDEKNKKREERKAHAMRFVIRFTAAAAILAMFVMITPLRNYVVSASNDVKSWIKDISSENNRKIEDSMSKENNDNRFENYYIISDKDFKGGIAYGDTLCIVPNGGEKDSVPIIEKSRLVTNTGDEQGRDYFHVWISDSNRIWISVERRVQRHAHLKVEISYEDGTWYSREWDLITNLPEVRFSSVTPNGAAYEKAYVGEVFEPNYYVVVCDEHNNVRNVNYLKGTSRIKWSTTDESIATVDGNGVITCISPGYTIIKADTGLGNVNILNVKVLPPASNQTSSDSE